MLQVTLNEEDRIIIITFKGEITVDDLNKMVNSGLSGAVTLGQTGGFALIADIRELEDMTPEAQTYWFDLDKQYNNVGVKGYATVFKDRHKPIIKKYQESRVKGGFFARYFLDYDKAYEWAKETMAEALRNTK